MIISASRRTDIPSFYSDGLYNSIKNKSLIISKGIIDLSPEVVDCIVFWTKNPKPMMDRLHKLKDYMYYFQFTLNSYGTDIEPYVPSKSGEVIDTFRRLSDIIGPERVIWRYDPIFFTDKYTLDYHKTYYEKVFEKLNGYTKKCVISFLDKYDFIIERMPKLLDGPSTVLGNMELAKHIASIAIPSMEVSTCAEGAMLHKYGITHNKCIDDGLISKLIGRPLNVAKDPSQRTICGCAHSIDIGGYNTCKNGCKYCYATKATDTSIGREYESTMPNLAGKSLLYIGKKCGNFTYNKKYPVTVRFVYTNGLPSTFIIDDDEGDSYTIDEKLWNKPTKLFKIAEE